MRGWLGLFIILIVVAYSIICVPLQYFSCIGRGGIPVESMGFIACAAKK